MKGGITSGVVYPLAACELAKSFVFKNIGGASAGAIAAVVTAAAEFRRRNGDPGGFVVLESLPKEVGQPGRLVGLFQPDPATRRLFYPLLATLRWRGRWLRVLAFLASALWHSPGFALLGALPGLALAALTAWSLFTSPAGEGASLANLAGDLLLALGGAVALVAVRLYRTVFALPDNFYGLCTGAAGATALTSWLADKIDEAAGKPSDRPLTFGDLWRAPRLPGDGGAGSDDHAIDLQVMTTDLSHGRPRCLPFDNQLFFFHPAEFRRLFPARIVAWMETKAKELGQLRNGPDPSTGLLPLPKPEDLPVVVAARMSLSYPILISAIPLYACDFSRPAAAEAIRAGRAPDYERCWFSDGGICLNFPVYLFDQPVPRWPAFAVNLRAFPPDLVRSKTEAGNVLMPRTNRDGVLECWQRFDSDPHDQPVTDSARLAGFFGAILDAMQNWHDNIYLTAPGYRDRIVHVCQAADEGGMNLEMPPATIDALSERGRAAGERLRAIYDPPALPPPDALSWDNHRWVRFRSTLATLAEFLQSFRAGVECPRPGDRPLVELLRRGPEEPPNSYRWGRPEQEGVADKATALLTGCAKDLAAGADVADGAPRPAPVLRIMPRV
jgi:hypothetical protein